MKVRKLSTSQRGFTIIELLIATTIFSVILLMASSGIVHIGRLYYKGVTRNRTQETVRNVAEEITRSVQFGRGAKVPGAIPETATGGSFCVGDTRYIYSINQKVDVDMGTHALIAQRLGSQACNPGAAPPSDPGKELLSNNMRLLAFSVQPESYDTRSHRVTVRVAYGENDLLDLFENDGTTPTAVLPVNGKCKTGIAGGDFCATAQLDTIVKKRLN